MSIATLYVSNVSEDVWPFIASISNPQARQFEIEENAMLSDRDLLAWAGKDHLRLVLPHAIDPEFWQYYLDTFGNQDAEAWVPRLCTGQTCLDLVADPELLQQITDWASGYDKLHLISYATSPQLYVLLHTLQKLGLNVAIPEAPEESDAWTVNFFGSKSGIRQLAQQSLHKEPDFLMSPGMIVSDRHDAAKIAAKMYIKNKGVVVKINKGHSGAGVQIWREGELPASYEECRQAIANQLAKDAYWDEFSIVIEELVNINPALGGGNPSVEFKIQKSGEVKFLYYCGMRVTKDGVFKGVEMHKDVLPEKIATQLTDTGFYVAEHYASQGYRGYFDLDFVGAKNGQILVTESNVRRTGGSHVYLLAKELFGPDFLYQTYALSTNLYNLPTKSIKTFRELYSRLESILYQPKTKEGLVLASGNLLAHHQMAYVIFGKTKARALAIEAEMEELLKKPSKKSQKR